MGRRVVRNPYASARVVQYSGGIGSWATSVAVREKYGTEGLELLFADTLIEDDDLYRFLLETAADIFELDRPVDLIARANDLPPLDESEVRKVALLELARDARERIPGLKWVAEGRDPWELFFDRRFLGNARIDPCSEMLKRKFLRRWMDEHHDPNDTVAYIGIDWTEIHRLEKARPHWKPWVIEAPLCLPPYHAKSSYQAQLEFRGIALPRLYELGFPHNNCGGFCVKAGMKHFKHLANTLPERFAYHERREQEIRAELGDVAILRDRTKAAKDANDGKGKPLPLRDLRQRLIEGGEIDEFDWGGCGCAL